MSSIDTREPLTTAAALRAVASEIGPVVVCSDDPAHLALELAEALDATLVDDLDELTAASLAVAMPSPVTEVCDIDELARIGRRLLGAHGLVTSAHEAAVERARDATDVVLHADSIRHAAAAVLDARADLLEFDRIEAAGSSSGAGAGDGDVGDAGSGGVGPGRSGLGSDFDEAEESTFQRFWEVDDDAPDPDGDHVDDREHRDDGDTAWPLWVSVVALVVEAVLGVVVFLAGDEEIGLLLAAVAVAWIIFLWFRTGAGRADGGDGSTTAPPAAETTGSGADHGRNEGSGHASTSPEVAANLALAMGQVSGGQVSGAQMSGAQMNGGQTAGSAGTATPVVTREEAERRLQLAEDRWRALLGPDVSVEDLEAELAARDATRTPGLDVVAEQSASVRAARRHQRRLEAQWKLAFWAMDLEPPDSDGVEDALASLRAGGIERVEFRTVAARHLVVLDEDGVLEFDRAEAASSPSVRVVVVQPSERVSA